MNKKAMTRKAVLAYVAMVLTLVLFFKAGSWYERFWNEIDSKTAQIESSLERARSTIAQQPRSHVRYPSSLETTRETSKKLDDIARKMGVKALVLDANAKN